MNSIIKSLIKWFVFANIITIVILGILLMILDMSYSSAEMALFIIAALVLFIGICGIKSPRTTATDFVYQYSRTASHQDIKSRWGQDFDLIRSGYGFFIHLFIVGITMLIYCFAVEKLFL